jgi:hypothetical protein
MFVLSDRQRKRDFALTTTIKTNQIINGGFNG